MGYLHQIFPLRAQETPQKVLEPVKIEDTRRTNPSKSIEQRSDRTETEATGTGYTGVRTAIKLARTCLSQAHPCASAS